MTEEIAKELRLAAIPIIQNLELLRRGASGISSFAGGLPALLSEANSSNWRTAPWWSWLSAPSRLRFNYLYRLISWELAVRCVANPGKAFAPALGLLLSIFDLKADFTLAFRT